MNGMKPLSATLTPRQAQILALIRRYISDTGYPPTRADIAAELDSNPQMRRRSI